MEIKITGERASNITIGSGPEWADCIENCIEGCYDKPTGIPDEAMRHFDRGQAAAEMANSPADYEEAIREFKQAGARR